MRADLQLEANEIEKMEQMDWEQDWSSSCSFDNKCTLVGVKKEEKRKKKNIEQNRKKAKANTKKNLKLMNDQS